MFALVASLKKNRRLLRDLVSRDLRARYVGSSMGFFWSLVFPVISLFVYMFVFRLVLKTRWSDQQGTAEVALLMLAGIMVWQAFAEATSRSTNTLAENQNLIQKVVFPSEVLPVYLTVSSLINMLIGISVAVLGVVWFAYFAAPDGPPRPPPRPVAFGAAAVAGDVASPKARLSTDHAFRCASGAGTRFTERGVVDAGEAPWGAAAAGLGPGAFAGAGWGDTVLAASGEWAVARGKHGYELEVDRWRAPDGAAAPPPRDGTQVVVAGDPQPAMGLGPSLLLLPLLLALQSAFTLGLGCFLATLNLFVRDTFHLIGVLLTVWMFATPIFYPERMVRDAGYGWILDWNPMHWLIHAYRSVLVYGAWPDWRMVGSFALAAALALVVGSRFFLSQKPRFPDLL